MKRIFRALVILSCCAGLSACTLPRGAAINAEVLKEQNAENPDFQVVAVTQSTIARVNSWPRAVATTGRGWIRGERGPDSQIIRSNDRVTVTIWDNEPNSLLTPAGAKSIIIPDIVVSSGGTIFLPYVENVLIRGLTPDQARQTLQTSLTAIAPSAQVQLNVQPGQGNAVDVVSGVTKPGTYPLPDRNSTILSVMAQAGGISPGLRNPLVRL
ncbi:MAG: polysaccharide biosynthesis/export family protein, partial [Gemmobacter sp.]